MPETTTAVELDGQYRALRDEAGFLDRSGRTMLTVGGADAVEYLQGQLTNDIEALGGDDGCYAALLDRKGHLQADMRVLLLNSGTSSDVKRVAPDRSALASPGVPRTKGELWLDLEPGPAPAALRHLRTYSIGRQVEIEDVSERWAITSLIGPRAAELAGVVGLSPEHAQRYRDWEGIEVLAVATDLGLDLITRSEQADALRELLRAGGAVEVSEEAVEILRVESGRPRFGLDMSEELMPAEAGITDRAVDFEKGCYIGQEPVARLHYRGRPNRRLRGLRLSGSTEQGKVLRLGEREVGTLGTVCLSPALGPIALAVVRREASEGDSLEVGDGQVTAEVVELPFKR